jgi:hypothetical protein
MKNSEECVWKIGTALELPFRSKFLAGLKKVVCAILYGSYFQLSF